MISWKKTALIAGIATLALGLTACGSGSGKEKATEGDGPTTLLMYQIGDKPENHDELMEIANKRIEEKINAKVDLQYIGWGDWDDKMSTIIASGENFDLSFSTNFVSNAQKGAYADLTELAPKYAKDIYEQLDEAYIKGNTIDGKLYAIPVNGNVFSEQMLTFNKHFLDTYDISIDGINSYADAEEALKKFHEKEPNIAAFAVGSSFLMNSNYDFPLGNEMPFAVKTNAEGGDTEIINQYTDSEKVDNLKLMHKWYKAGYIPADAATNTAGYDLDQDTWFMREETQGPMDYGDTILTNAAGKELVSRPITAPIKSTSNAQMANWVVSNVSKNKEKAVELLNLLNTDAELLNGLVYGIEGEAWEKTGEGKLKLLDGYKPNTHMTAWNTGNNAILYTQDTITDEMIAERDKSIEEAVASPILGFSFKTAPVKTEITNISNVMNRYNASLNTGTVDPEETLPKLLEDLEKAGWEKVREEMQKQFDEFRAGE